MSQSAISIVCRAVLDDKGHAEGEPTIRSMIKCGHEMILFLQKWNSSWLLAQRLYLWNCLSCLNCCLQVAYSRSVIALGEAFGTEELPPEKVGVCSCHSNRSPVHILARQCFMHSTILLYVFDCIRIKLHLHKFKYIEFCLTSYSSVSDSASIHIGTQHSWQVPLGHNSDRSFWSHWPVLAGPWHQADMEQESDKFWWWGPPIVGSSSFGVDWN